LDVVSEDARVRARDSLKGSHAALNEKLLDGLNPYVAAAEWMGSQ
jgi:hypothetical protein